MNFDFKEPISGYEFLALCISVAALLEPLFVFLWKKFVQKAKLNYFQNGSIELFFNRSGSYVHFFGTLQAENKSVIVKKIKLKITRLKDNSERNLLWSTFISPHTQLLGNNFLHTNETIHPFFLDTKNVSCAFLEFSDPAQSVYKEFCNIVQQGESEIKKSIQNNNYESAILSFRETNCCKELQKMLDKDLFWQIGKYSLELTFEYDNTFKTYLYNFSIGESENNLMKNNFNETLISPIKEKFNVNLNYRNCSIEVHSGKE